MNRNLGVSVFAALFALRFTGNGSRVTLVCLCLGREAELCVSVDGLF